MLVFYNRLEALTGFLEPLINIFENINDVIQPSINSFREFLKDTINIDCSGKKLPSCIESFLKKNYNLYKLLPEFIQKDVKTDLNLFLNVYDLFIHFSPLILVLIIVFF